jgi:hypothetical protein
MTKPVCRCLPSTYAKDAFAVMLWASGTMRRLEFMEHITGNQVISGDP